MSYNRTTPVDAFLKFFQDTKPYHVKVLEVLETFRLNDDICVNIRDNLTTEITYKNKPLCRIVGFGLEFDDECGFDALSCCDYFSCLGGYGLIFDNSDLLASYSIVGSDTEAGYLEVQGDATTDTFIQISDVTEESIFIEGDYSAIIGQDRILTISPVSVLQIINNDATTITVNGDLRRIVAIGNEIGIRDSGVNNGNYNVLSIYYDEVADVSIIDLFTNGTTFQVDQLETIHVASKTKNNGYYVIESTLFDGSNTVITLSTQTPIRLPNEIHHGSIVLRRGLYSGRDLWLYDPTADSNEPIKVSESFYDVDTETTRIYILSQIEEIGENSEARLYGYLFNGGYDNSECSGKSPDKLGASFIENILIQIIEESCYIISEAGDRIISEGGDFVRPEICTLPEICPIALEDEGFFLLEEEDGFIVLEDCNDTPVVPNIFVLSTEDDFIITSEFDDLFVVENSDQFE